MMCRDLVAIPACTPVELLDAAVLGVRLEILGARSEGADPSTIERQVIYRYRRILGDCDLDVYQRETVMAAVQRAVIRTLKE